MKLTIQQKIVLGILKDYPNLEIGDLQHRFYQLHSTGSKRLVNVMKRNSKMSSWMNQLEEKELIIIDYINRTYKASSKALVLLKRSQCDHSGEINNGHHHDQPCWCNDCGEEL